MPVKTIADWNNQSVNLIESSGGVRAVEHPFRNLVRGDVKPWPPAEVLQKLYRSHHGRHFTSEDGGEVAHDLGFYCDLQSLHSEDAITWSVFGTIAYAAQTQKRQFVGALLELLGLPAPTNDNVAIWLWRRLPHPDTLVPGGPEIDFGIQTDDTLLLGEAKWLSGVGQLQGVAKDKNQVVLRQEFCRKYGQLFFANYERLVVLGVSLDKPMLETSDEPLACGSLHTRSAIWSQIAALTAHPHHDEITRYLEWKKSLSNLPHISSVG